MNGLMHKKNLYDKKASIQKRPLKKKIQSLKIEKDEIVASLFTNISLIRDQLASIGVAMDEYYLLQTIIDGLPSSWETFLGCGKWLIGTT